MIIGGPNVIDNGLRLCVDAGNKTSYSGSGTLWKNLALPTYDGTLVNTPAYDGNSFAFTQTSTQYCNFGDVGTYTEATFIVWLKRNGNTGSYDAILHSRGGGGGTSGFIFSSTANTLGYNWNDSGSAWGWNSGITIDDNTWYMAALVVSATDAKIYLNGHHRATNTLAHASTDLKLLYACYDSFQADRYFNGSIAIAQLYNRVLTDNEMLQNFNAHRSRFNL